MQQIATVECKVFSPGQIAFLRGVVRDSLTARGVDTSRRQAELIARQILDAYSSGVLDRAALLAIARARSSQFSVKVLRPAPAMEDSRASLGSQSIKQLRRPRGDGPTARLCRSPRAAWSDLPRTKSTA
jgi:hypothetical protein